MIIVGVSGGVDSIVLLDILYKKGYRIVVAHVNYNKRIDSYKDALVIEEYIRNKDIIFETLQVNHYTNENFQAQARKIRFDFYVNLMSKYQATSVHLAHHKDDFIETYLFKQRRKGSYNYYGIKQEDWYQDIMIYRDLIDWYKEDIIAYAFEHRLAYHEDSSNKELVYTRNIIRDELKQYTRIEKDLLYEQANQLNRQIELDQKIVDSMNTVCLKLSEFSSYSCTIKQRFIFQRFKKYDMSIEYQNEIIRMIETANNFSVNISNTYLIKAYDKIYMLDSLIDEYYFAVVDDCAKDLVVVFFKQYGIEVELPISYPYIVRSITNEDLPRLGLTAKQYKKKMIMRKIPAFLRKNHPIIDINGKDVFFLNV